MRIRKHAQILPLLINGGSTVNQEEGGGGAGAGAVIQTTPHLCQLNQSPWDVLAFPLSEYPENPTEFLPPPLPPPPPVDGEVSSMENGSISDCPEDENSGLSLNLEKWDEVIDKNRKFEFEENEEIIQEMETSHYRKKIKERHSNYPGRTYKLPKKPGKNPDINQRGPRPKKHKSSSNPYEFYYYSGFGPRWGKNRRGAIDASNVEGGTNGSESLIPVSVIDGSRESYDSESLETDYNAIEVDNRTSLERIVFEDSSPDRIHDNGFDYVDDEDEDDDDDDNKEFVTTRKRGRKPIKARSLKSIM